MRKKPASIEHMGWHAEAQRGQGPGEDWRGAPTKRCPGGTPGEVLLQGFAERIRHALPICGDLVASSVSLLCGCSVLDPGGAREPSQ